MVDARGDGSVLGPENAKDSDVVSTGVNDRIGRSLLRSRGPSLMNAWTCAAVMSVAPAGVCAAAEVATSNKKIPTNILRMRQSLPFFCVAATEAVRVSPEIRHAAALQSVPAKLGFFCSARLQAGTLKSGGCPVRHIGRTTTAIPNCPPEGGRYTIEPNLGGNL